jgi:AcrR family transcriptional regulator
MRPAGAVAAPRSGRPRSAEADRAIIDAALEAVIESGIDGVSIEQVAARAGVAKATVYRRWANKEALVLDALVAVDEPLPELAGVSVRDDLVVLVDGIRRRGKHTMATRLYPRMISEALRHPEIAAKYKKIVVEQRRELVRETIRRGMVQGEIRSDLDVETMLLLVCAPMLIQTHVWNPGVELPEDSSARYVDAVLQGLRPRVGVPPVDVALPLGATPPAEPSLGAG